MAERSKGAISRFGRFLSEAAGLSAASASSLITAFARGEQVVVPAVSNAFDPAGEWDWQEERAGLIAEHGLYSTLDEQAADQKAASAKQIAERRAQLNKDFLAWGAEGLADELSADLTVSIPQARARIIAFKEEQRSNPSYQTIEERARGMTEFGSDTFDPEPIGATRHKLAMETALARHGAKTETEKNG